MKKTCLKNLSVAFLMLSCTVLSAQTITVKDTLMKTYPFSDPDPIPATSGIYPYHRFGTFSQTPAEQKWKMVVLENEWIRVKIMPEIGGKIWSIYDKVHQKELFYDNDVVKFREISLRGPWTSGGIEFNYGVIGHAPSCAHPVDYKTEYKPDGSVSCYIGVSELLTRSRWTVEINLPKDALWVKTRSFWHNYSGMFQPYYSWANSGVEITDDTKLIFPGHRYIGHDGNAHDYPTDEEGRDLSYYKEQAFGRDKSFHIVGSHKSFFGTWWMDDDCGMLHYALRDEKVGRKYFSWSQSEQGEIWVDLLTDTRPQYVELQSGRLFNQNQWSSAFTPFKQTIFNPYATDEWTEYWMPFAGIGEVDDLTLDAAVNVVEKEGSAELKLFALKKLDGDLTFIDQDGRSFGHSAILVAPSQNMEQQIEVPAGRQLSRITLDGKTLWSSDDQELDRPDIITPEFDINSVQGQIAHARYLFGMRKYDIAEEKIDHALEMDPSQIAALDLKAALCYRSMRYEEAADYTDKVLSIDTYDSWANYIGGLAKKKTGKIYDAMDRFEIAAISSELRSAACTELARLHFLQGNHELAEDYVRKSLVMNAHNLTAWEILQQIHPSDEILDQISSLDPLQHFTDMEKMLSGKISREELNAAIQEEMKGQNHFENAAFYMSLGLDGKALDVLDADPEKNILNQLWTAYLKKDVASIRKAEQCSVDLVFPFREESVEILRWAIENGGGWKSHYLLAMAVSSLGHQKYAKELLDGQECDFAPFYSFRASLDGNEKDLEKAMELDPQQWRHVQNLASHYSKEGRHEEALDILEPYFKKHPGNFHIGDSYVKTLIALKDYKKAEKVLGGMKILPFEGQTGSHEMHRDIQLHLAAEKIDKGQYRAALAKISKSQEWPWSLGVGKPYDELIDNALEDWLSAIVYKRMGQDSQAEEYLKKVRQTEEGERLAAAFQEAVQKDVHGKYPEVMSMLGNLDASYDKKLF